MVKKATLKVDPSISFANTLFKLPAINTKPIRNPSQPTITAASPVREIVLSSNLPLLIARPAKNELATTSTKDGRSINAAGFPPVIAANMITPITPSNPKKNIIYLPNFDYHIISQSQGKLKNCMFILRQVPSGRWDHSTIREASYHIKRVFVY